MDTVYSIAKSVGSGTPQTDLDRLQREVDSGQKTLNDIRVIFGVPTQPSGLVLVALAAALYFLFFRD